MRCLTPVTIYAFTGTGTTRGTYAGVTLGTVDATTCPAGQYVAITQAENDLFRVSPFNLSLAEAGSITGAILSLWALGLGVRLVIRALRDTTNEGQNTE